MSERARFGSKLGGVLVAAGGAVGLGNIWRFPTEVGSNGGAAFILIYLACVVFVGLPVMLSEFIIGRHTRKNAIGAFRQLAPNRLWTLVGTQGIVVAFLILCYYIVVSGWTAFYTVSSAAGLLTGERDFSVFFAKFVASGWMPVAASLLCMAAVHVVVVRGVKEGIERASKIMMPALLLIIGLLIVGSFSMSGFREGVEFLLKPDFSKVTVDVALGALGQSFYSLSLAMGGLCTYASYFSRDANLVKTGFSVASVDTSVAVLAGFVIFPAVFTVGVNPGMGPSLVFITLPSVFNMAFTQMAWVGYLFSGMFYVLLFLAALTSAISLHEPVTAYLSEETGLSRRTAARLVSMGAGLISIACALSLGPWKDFLIAGMTLFDLFNFITAKIILPLGGIFIAVFAGWVMDRRIAWDELTNQGKHYTLLFRIWRFLVRWVSPTAIIAVFVHELLG